MEARTDIPSELAQLMVMAPAGFAIALHVRLMTPSYLFQTYPAAWVEEYGRDGLVLRDPTVAWAFANTGQAFWSDLAPTDASAVLARAAAHGLVHGVVVSVLRGESRSMASFARSDRAFTPDEVARLDAAFTWLHDATAAEPPLAPEARDALRRLSVAFTHP